MKPRLSLKGRGLQMLAQREHSRSELRRKLMPHAVAAATEPAAMEAHAAASREQAPDAPAVPSAAEQVDAVLDWLQAHRYLSEERFVESRVHARASRYGNLRIRLELAQHGVALTSEAAQHLKQSELARAREVWLRRFGVPPENAAERAKQMRFLAGRGFSGEAIRRVIQGVDDE